MNLVKSLFAIPVLVALVAGCQSNPPQKTDDPKSANPAAGSVYPLTTSVSYILPQKDSWGAKTLISNLPKSRFSAGFEGYVDTTIEQRGDHEFTVTRTLYSNKTEGFTRAHATHRVAFSEQLDPKTKTVQFKALDYEGDQIAVIGKWWIPKLKADEMVKYLGSSALPHAMEIDSEFSESAILANFQRILGPGVRIKDGTFEFSMEFRGRRVALQVQVFPYRTGSKTLVRTKIPAVMDESSRTVNFVSLVSDFESHVSAIVKN